MSEREYRQDDETRGYCTLCGAPLSNVTVSAQGYCERHGLVSADWTPIKTSTDHDWSRTASGSDDDEGDDTP